MTNFGYLCLPLLHRMGTLREIKRVARHESVDRSRKGWHQELWEGRVGGTISTKQICGYVNNGLLMSTKKGIKDIAST